MAIVVAHGDFSSLRLMLGKVVRNFKDSLAAVATHHLVNSGVAMVILAQKTMCELFQFDWSQWMVIV